MHKCEIPHLILIKQTGEQFVSPKLISTGDIRITAKCNQLSILLQNA